MTKESYNFGVDTEAKRLYTETSGMTAKRFEVHKVIGSFHEWSIEDNLNDKVVFGCIMHKYEADRLCKVLNELHEENQSLKKHISELYENVKFDVDNEIEVYPKVLLEYIVNILKIIGDVE